MLQISINNREAAWGILHAAPPLLVTSTGVLNILREEMVKDKARGACNIN